MAIKLPHKYVGDRANKTRRNIFGNKKKKKNIYTIKNARSFHFQTFVVEVINRVMKCKKRIVVPASYTTEWNTQSVRFFFLDGF
jgi:hypothetical protein